MQASGVCFQSLPALVPELLLAILPCYNAGHQLQTKCVLSLDPAAVRGRKFD